MENHSPAAPDANQPPTPTPADEAQAGTPHYGTFGEPDDVDAGPHLPRRTYVGSYLDPAGTVAPEPFPTDPAEQRGHVNQNQDTAAVVAAQGQSEAVEQQAFDLDDPRYDGGDKFNPKKEQTGF